jgi:antitoxin ParD1/3/4
METMNVALPQGMKDFVHRRMAEAGYSSASEYVRSLIRADQERTARESLETEILRGLQSGDSTPMTPEDWEEIRREVRRRCGQRSEQ